MSIKSDLWIRRMATEQQMIAPFLPELVREDKNGNRIISAGASSYGYDIIGSENFNIIRAFNIWKNIYNKLFYLL